MKDKDKKKKKLSSSGMTTKEKMLARKKALESKGNNNGLIFPKEGSTRIRLKSPGDDQELGIEVVQFYLQGVGGIISPATFDEPCPFMEKYQELKQAQQDVEDSLAIIDEESDEEMKEKPLYVMAVHRSEAVLFLRSCSAGRIIHSAAHAEKLKQFLIES